MRRLEEKPPCEVCRRLKGMPDCSICLPPLLKENEEALMVYSRCHNQVVTAAMGEVIDINLASVKLIMDLYGVENQKECMEKVVSVFHKLLADKKLDDKLQRALKES